MQNQNLPDKYIESMRELLGEDELAKYLESFNEPRLFGLRVNTSKISVEDFLKISPFKLTPVPWIPNGFYYEESDKPAKHPYYFAGLYYLQEPSAMTPAHVLPINEGERVLDLCAAPGGKSTELGARLNGTGLLVSNDVSASRAKALLKNIEIFGIGNVFVTCEYPEKLAMAFPEFFDKILVDAPCSGEGMFRKDSKLIKSWVSQGPDFFALLQRSILENAFKMLKPNGYILYSTCTFSKMEDEDNIQWLLSEHEELELERIYDYEGFTRAFGMEEAIRLLPHKIKGEGHFVALLHKKGNSSIEKYMDFKASKLKLPVEITDFLSELIFEIDTDRIDIIGERVYLYPYPASVLKGIRAMRTGTLLGEIKKNRFEPSQAFAMTLKPEDYSTVINLHVDDIRVIKYLKGETIDFEESELRGSNKTALVAVDGFSLGWSKINGTTLKNKYLAGWRWL